MPNHLINTTKELEDCCAELADEDWLTLDTEFMRERTYYPQLCLVQIGTAKDHFCIDALADMPLDKLFELICLRKSTTILHAARQDLEIFFHRFGSFNGPLFDSQVAAGLFGLDAQVGYAGLIKELIGKELEKGYQRANWEKRPLPDGQLKYALDDVIYLAQAYPMITERLQELGRLEWAQEDSARLLNRDLYVIDPDTAYKRIGAVRGLPAAEQHIMKKLAAWREQVAQKTDQPRTWVVSDNTLIYMAQVKPESVSALQKVKGVKPGLIEQDNEIILAAIQEGVDSPSEELMSKSAPLTDAEQKLYKVLRKKLEQHSEHLQIKTPVLGTRKDLESLLRGNTNSALLKGWRKSEIGEELLSMCPVISA